MAILITRPFSQAKKTAALLETKGYITFIDPLLDICPVPLITPFDPSEMQAIIVTSVYGARFCPWVESFAALPLFAVGDATGKEARERGFKKVINVNGAAMDLCASAMGSLSPQQGKILYFSGDVMAVDISTILQRQGFQVERRIVYQAQPASALSPATCEALVVQRIKVALFFSLRTTETFVKLVEQAMLSPLCASITAICLSKPIMKSAEKLPFQRILCADAPRLTSILRLLERSFPPLGSVDREQE